jgi:putative alpha-1,2-mannosidase
MQIDGQVLRRSPRFTPSQEQEVLPTLLATSVIKPLQKKVCAKKTLSNALKAYEEITISEVVKLTKYNFVNDTESELITSVLQRIIRNAKKLKIRNRIKDMYDRRAEVMAFVCTSFKLSYEVVDDMLDAISCYKEVKEAQMISARKNITNDLDSIINSFAIIKL